MSFERAILVTNAAVAVAVSALAAVHRVHAAVAVVLPFTLVDGVLLGTDARDLDPAFRDSLLAHHALCAVLCAQFLAHFHDGSSELARTMLLFELTTPAVCAAKLWPHRTVLRTVVRPAVWLSVRGWLSWRVFALIHERLLIDPNAERFAPYAIAIVTLTVAWTVGARHAISHFQLLLPAYVAFRHGQTASALLFVVQTACSHAFYANPAAALRRRADRACIAALVFHVGLRLPVAVSLALGTAMHATADALCILVVLAHVQTFEAIACIGVMTWYVGVHGGPVGLTFGHRVLWHAAAAVIGMRALARAREENVSG